MVFSLVIDRAKMLKLGTSFPAASRRYHVKFYQFGIFSLAQWPWTVLAAVAMTGLLLVLAGEPGPSRALA
jgi:hypothetical protein